MNDVFFPIVCDIRVLRRSYVTLRGRGGPRKITLQKSLGEATDL